MPVLLPEIICIPIYWFIFSCMNAVPAYLDAMKPLLPVLTSLTGAFLIGFSIPDSLTVEERRLKKIVLLYLVTTVAGWFTTFLFEVFPEVFIYFNVLCLLGFIFVPLLFYRVVHFLTRLGKKENFNRLHYLIPFLLAGTLLVWSLFVPLDIQLEIVSGKSHVVPEGYEFYTRLFFLPSPSCGVFSIVYFTLTVFTLVRYYRKANDTQSLVRKAARWVIFLMVITATMMTPSLVTAVIDRTEMFTSPWVIVAILSVAGQHALLVFYIIRRQYKLYVVYPDPAEEQEEQTKPIVTGRRYFSGTVTRKKLEGYFSKEKPYLNPSFRIADLVEVLDVNRTAISSFINKTYGMNFNSYVNKWRIEELERLATLPSNEGKSIGSYVSKAGFADLRQYYRVIKREEESKSGAENIKRGAKK